MRKRLFVPADSGRASTLTPKRLELLAFIERDEPISTSQLRQRLAAVHGKKFDRSLRESLRWAFDAGLVVRTRLAVALGQGSSPLLYSLTARGRQLLSTSLPKEGGLRRALRPAKNQLFLAHHAACTDVRIAIELSAKSLGAGVEWTTERELRLPRWRIPTYFGAPIIPDAYCVLTRPDGSVARLLVEIDLGTVAPSRVSRKLEGYARIDALPEAFGGPTSAVVWLTNTPGRLKSVERLSERIARLPPGYLWLAVLSDVTPDAALTAPIFHVVGDPGRHSLIDPEYVASTANSLASDGRSPAGQYQDTRGR
jgi:hypothetical protein